MKWAEDCSAEGLIAAVKAMKNRPDRSYILEQLNVPVQFIVGERNSVFNYAIAFKQATYPKISMVHFMRNIGHMGMIENYRRNSPGAEQFCYLLYRANLKSSGQKVFKVFPHLVIQLHKAVKLLP